MSSSLISTEHLSKSYGKGENLFQALRDVSLDIEQGDSVAIIGKSGSGKSTLMHILALMDEPTDGKVMIAGKIASDMSTQKLDKLRNVTFGFVFQQFFLSANTSVLENVILPLKIAGVSSRERKRRGLEALLAVELDEKANNKAKDLSGGEKQRVAIARALINEPQIIFADEPTGNLDSKTGVLIEKLLFKLNKEKGITLIIVTHDEDLAKRCARQIHIKDGKLTGASR